MRLGIMAKAARVKGLGLSAIPNVGRTAART
ncbi:MAG: hypothetical protein QOI01_1654 [Mycobacterium sp.]|jgi:hypothetical protein|nr:hypothetical protein [Mycobacterium sp.]